VSDRLLEILSVERFGARSPEGLEAKLAEIREVVREACAVVSDDVLRTEYLAGRVS
jgi:hypothetical protein